MLVATFFAPVMRYVATVSNQVDEVALRPKN
jgi:hypothetical protein